MSQPAVLQVVILRDGLLVGTEVFVPGSYTFGSAPDADLKLEDPTVSAQHGVLYFQNNRAAIQDAGSVTGLFVNGHKVSACEIRAVDEVLVGPFVLKVRVIEKKAAAQKPSPSPEVASLLKGASPPPPGRGGGGRAPLPLGTPVGMANTVPTMASPPARAASPDATVASARRLQAVPQAAVATPDAHPARAGHLRPVPAPVEERATEHVVLPDLFNDLTDPGAALKADHTSTRSMRPMEMEELAHELDAAVSSDNIPIAPRSGAPSLTKTQISSKKAPKLYFELYWGEVRREARAFEQDKKRRPITGGADEISQMPLYGFSVPELKDEKGKRVAYTLAEPAGQAFRVFVPPKAKVEKAATSGASFMPAQAEGKGSQRFVTLSLGQAVRFTEGEMALVAYVAPPPEKIRVNPLKGLPWLAIFLFLVFGGGVLSFLIYGPKPPELPDFQAKSVPLVAVKLLAPEKKEEAKKLVEKLKKKEPEKKAEVAKKEKKIEEAIPKPVQQAPEAKALKALAKLTAAGPMKDLTAAMDKLGGGPGDKRKTDFKLSGLVGKQPIANAGVGLFGLGGGGKGGAGIKGIEQLHGLGGGGIGALGAGGVGHGAVGGVVTRASARTIGVSGNIDRDAVAKCVNSHLQEVRACYERALLKETSLAGKVVLEWTISTTGSVVTAKTKSSTLKNGAVEACILQSLKTWRFPQAKGGSVIVSYPFLFNSVGY